jgi:hypothetical protein
MKEQGVNNYEGLTSEANGNRSREVITLTGGDFPSGTVLGQVTASKKYTELAPGAADGSQVAAAVLATNVNAASEDKSAVAFARDCEWSESLLGFNATLSGAEVITAKAELKALGIIARTDEDS